MTKLVRIFDLDGTVIDSRERVNPCLKPNGDLCLQTYIDTACTPRKVMRDKLLPLVELMRSSIDAGETVVICTARHMAKHDYIFLRQNGIKVPLILSRDRLKDFFPQRRVNRIYKSSDKEYKKAYFYMLKSMYPDASFIMYDDHPQVLDGAREVGFDAVDAKQLNEHLIEALTEQADSHFNEIMEDLDYMEAYTESFFGLLTRSKAI